MFITSTGERKYGEWRNGIRERWIIFGKDQEVEEIEKEFEPMINIKATGSLVES